MVTKRYVGKAKAVNHLETISLSGSIVVGKNFWITINTKRINFLATTTVVADVVAGLLAALNATDGSVPQEFLEASWISPSAGVITATGLVAGNPLSISVNTDGAATFVNATTTAATGPTFWNNVNNWSDGVLPVSGDVVVIDNFAGDITDGLDQSGVTLSLLVTGMSFTGTIGRPRQNANGYPDYRELSLKIGATILRIGVGTGQGSGRIRINVGGVLTNAEVEAAAQGLEPDVPAVLLQGTNASNVWDFSGGSVGLAFFEDEFAVAASLTVSSNATCRCGTGVTHTNVINSGTLTTYSATTTLNVYGGTVALLGTTAHADIDVRGGTVQYLTSGAATNVVCGPGTIDTQLDASPRTFTNTTLRAGGVINDPGRTITYTNKIAPDETVSSITAA